MAVSRVRFHADGITLAGHLHVPAERASGEHRLPAVVVAGPTPSVKEQVADNYAERLAAAGYLALTLDFRNYGESEGEPRQREDPDGKLADLRGAVSFLAGQPVVDRDRIGMVGVCAGAGYALKAAAFDRRVKAFAGIAGFYPDPRDTRQALGPDVYRKALLDAVGVAERQDLGGPVEYIPHVGHEGEVAAPPGRAGEEAFAFYGTPRGQKGGYRNQVTRDMGFTVLTLDNAIGADFISPTPVLLVHGDTDAGCPPEQAQAAYDRMGEPKRIVWLPMPPDSMHVDFYDNDDYVDPAVAETVSFLREHL